MRTNLCCTVVCDCFFLARGYARAAGGLRFRDLGSGVGTFADCFGGDLGVLFGLSIAWSRFDCRGFGVARKFEGLRLDYSEGLGIG